MQPRIGIYPVAERAHLCCTTTFEAKRVEPAIEFSSATSRLHPLAPEVNVLLIIIKRHIMFFSLTVLLTASLDRDDSLLCVQLWGPSCTPS